MQALALLLRERGQQGQKPVLWDSGIGASILLRVAK